MQEKVSSCKISVQSSFYPDSKLVLLQITTWLTWKWPGCVDVLGPPLSLITQWRTLQHSAP